MNEPTKTEGGFSGISKMLLFDFDGTVADTMSVAHDILNDMSREFGFRELPRERLEDARKMKTREFIRHLGIRSWRVPIIARRGLQLLHERIDLVQPIPGMPEVLSSLHSRGFKLAILTSNSEVNVNAFLQKHDLAYFDFVHSSSKIFGKGREIRSILKREKLRPQEILYIGDETRDIEAARETGLRVAAVSWGYNSGEALLSLDPDHMIDSPHDLLELLQKP